MTRACALAVVLLLPATAAAQQGAFIEALIEFDSALAGTYGDEGPRVEAAVDSMGAALETWNAESRAAEAALRAGSDAATLARFFFNQGRPAEALEAVDAAIERDPGGAGLHRLRGVLLEATARDTDAIASFERAWELDPDVVNAYLLADRMSTERLSERPERQLVSLLAAYEPGASARRAPFIHVGLIEDSAANEPRFSRPAYVDGFDAVARGRYEAAIGLFRTAMAQDPLIADRVARSGPAARGIAALRQDQVAAAVAEFEAAVEAAPASSEAHRLLGVAHAAAGDVEASVRWLEEAVRLAPADERARVALGRVLIESGRIEDAERVLLETIRRLPASGRARWALADLYELTRRGGDTLEQLDQAAMLPMLAGKTALLWRLANVANALFDKERVVSVLVRRTRLMRNDPFAHRSLGLAYHRAGRDVEALVELLVASHLGQEDAETLTVMGQIHLNADRLTMAETALRRAVAIEPESDTARYALARTLLRAGQDEEGRQQLAEFRRLQEALLTERQEKYQTDLRERTEQLRGVDTEDGPR